MRKTLLIFTCGLILAGFAGYTAFWFTTARAIDNEIAALYLEADKRSIIIDGVRPSASGFPGKHRISFSGLIHNGYMILAVPALEIRGFPLPDSALEVDFPRGLSLSSDVSPLDGKHIDSDIWSIDYLFISGIVPAMIPAAATVESLRAWRDSGAKFIIPSFALRKESLEASGKGEFFLDSDLQPSGNLALVASGHQPFLGWLQEKAMLEPKQALITSTVLNALAKDNGDGERKIEAVLTLQNRNVLFGPLRITAIPEIDWPYKERKALHFE
ncbi:MAG: DUF2125 domain-containing protein [Proteobacteria bacterium]|nr:DUF2125 domain-containing protein [Pseudomonadota bacterium]